MWWDSVRVVDDLCQMFTASSFFRGSLSGGVYGHRPTMTAMAWSWLEGKPRTSD